MRVSGLILSCLCLTVPLFVSANVTTQIQDIDYGQNMTEDILVFLKSGHVTKINPGNTKMLRLIQQKNHHDWLKIQWDQERYITDIQMAKSPYTLKDTDDFMIGEKNYTPTTVENMRKARKYFNEGQRTVKEETQCFNRAMVWSYEWWRKHSVKSNKIFIFFTRSYIRRYNFEWWFHIAPYLHIMENGSVIERAMDLKYSGRPLPFKKWTDLFMQRDPVCPVITSYSEYADHPYMGDCYIMRTHMYTYQPSDLQMYEAWGYNKDKFNMREVRGAYLEAFDYALP